MKVFAITTNYDKSYTRLFQKRKNAIRAMFYTASRDFDIDCGGEFTTDEDIIDYLCSCEDDEINKFFCGFITFRRYYTED